MELKTARLTLLIDPNKKAAFERLCAQQDLTASQVVRQMIRDYLAQHGVAYEPSGVQAVEAAEAGRAVLRAAASARPGARSAKTPGGTAGSRRKG
jgi:hypothetical protein